MPAPINSATPPSDIYQTKQDNSGTRRSPVWPPGPKSRLPDAPPLVRCDWGGGRPEPPGGLSRPLHHTRHGRCVLSSSARNGGPATMLAERPVRGPREPRQARSREAQRRILEAAEEALAADGFDDFTMAAVAERSGRHRAPPAQPPPVVSPRRAAVAARAARRGHLATPTRHARHDIWCFGLAGDLDMVFSAAGSAGHPGSWRQQGTRCESGTAPQR